jgi:hypothetical protein
MKKTTKNSSLIQDAQAYVEAMKSLPIHQEPVDPDLEEAFLFAENINDLFSDEDRD